MSRWLLLLFSLLVLSACSKSAQQAAPAQNAAAPTAPAATPAATPNAMAVAPTLATPGAPPANGKDAPKNLPNVIGDRLFRALTLEEINKMPPETRDAILRAQGRLPASPTPKKK